jgi:chlorobactene glucosyltransferase
VLSPHPRQVVVTFWERVIVPAGFFLLMVTRDVRRINDPRSRAAAVNGQCVLVRRSAYDAMGGHRAVAAEILEDVALARVAKREGLRLRVVDGSAFVRTRMYRSFGEIWRGLTKNAALAAGGPTLALPGAVALLGLAVAPVAVPLAAWLWGPAWSVGPALGGSAVWAALAAEGPPHFGLRRGWAVTSPLGLAAVGAITAASAVKTWRGTREWKGRRY